MSEAALRHPATDRLQRFGLGLAEPAEFDELECHVAQCRACCEVLREVPDDSFVDLARAATETVATDTETAGGSGGAASDLEIPAELQDHPRYQIIRPLGQGGMGVVFEARHRLMDRVVALKVIRRRFTCEPRAIERFRQEVRAAAQLSHPNIVAAFDAEQAGSVHFLAMELVRGVTLARLVQEQGPLPVAEAAGFARQVAMGLDHAHQRGMIHRDVKPQNLMLTSSGVVKILDFGLARFAYEYGLQGTSETASGITAANVFLGTPDYAAPEQIFDAHAADIRADVYSLGCTLRFLLTAGVLYPDADASRQLYLRMIQDPPPISRFRNDVPAELERVVEKMLAKDPQDRFQTPQEVVRALEPFCRPEPGRPGHPMASQTPQPGQHAARRWRTFLLLGVLPFLIAGVAGLVASGRLGALIHGQVAPSVDQPSRVAEEIPPLLVEDVCPPDNDEISQPADEPVLLPRGGEVPRRVLFVLPPRNLWYDDYGPVRAVLEAGNVEVVTTSTVDVVNADPAGGGRPVRVDLPLTRVNAKDYGAIVFPGGEVTAYMQDRPHGDRVKRLINAMTASDRFVAAICGGQMVLADAGELDGKSVALNEEVYEGFRYRNIHWRRQPVVISGHVITADSPEAARAFGSALMKVLGPGP